jgi:hypothetical protein
MRFWPPSASSILESCQAAAREPPQWAGGKSCQVGAPRQQPICIGLPGEWKPASQKGCCPRAHAIRAGRSRDETRRRRPSPLLPPGRGRVFCRVGLESAAELKTHLAPPSSIRLDINRPHHAQRPNGCLYSRAARPLPVRLASNQRHRRRRYVFACHYDASAWPRFRASQVKGPSWLAGSVRIGAAQTRWWPGGT